MTVRRNGGDRSVGRRSLLEWLGGSAVLALTSPLISACRVDGPGAHSADGGCDFAPGALARPDLAAWNVRTVDPQDLALLISTWSLRVDGLVQEPLHVSFCELRDLGLVRQVTDFHCVEGWSVYDVPWDGIPLSHLLAKVGPSSAAKFLKIHCVGGKYFEQLPIAVAMEGKTMLAIGVDGSTLPLGHGFPARIVVPRLLGYKSAKYVERIELVESAPEAFWPQYGYTMSGEVPGERLRPGKY